MTSLALAKQLCWSGNEVFLICLPSCDELEQQERRLMCNQYPGRGKAVSLKSSASSVPTGHCLR